MHYERAALREYTATNILLSTFERYLNNGVKWHQKWNKAGRGCAEINGCSANALGVGTTIALETLLNLRGLRASLKERGHQRLMTV